jgi:hypothetical protein
MLALAAFLPGCGGSTPEPPPPVETGAALKEIAEVYRYIVTQKAPTPRKVEDLVEYEGSLPGALPKIRDGQIVVVWGIGYSPGSTQVLAYAKDVPASGGSVLLRNGTVKDMSADEFRAAKK